MPVYPNACPNVTPRDLLVLTQNFSKKHIPEMALTLGLQWFQQWESTHYCHPILRASLCTAMKKWAQIIIEVCRLLENTSSLIWTRKIIAHFSNQTRRPKHDSAQKFSTEKLLTQISNETKGNHHHDQNGQCRVRNSVKAAGEFWSPKRK